MELFEAIESHDVSRLAMLLSTGADPNGSHQDSPSWTPLKTAIEELADGGPIEAVVLLLRHGAKVDHGRVPGNATPLLVAVMNRQAEAVRILLAAGADPNIRDDEGESPLSLSVQNDDEELVRAIRLCLPDAT